MGLTLQNLRDAILKATGTDLADWENGNIDLDLYSNQSWWDIMDQFDFREKEADPIVFATIEGTKDYALSGIVAPIIFDALQRVAIEDLFDFSHSDLDLISDFDYENEFVNSSDNYGKPQKYFRRGTDLILWPTPDDAYNISIYHLSVLSDLSSGGPVIPQSWHEIIKYGAIWRAMIDLRDFANSRLIKENQMELISGRSPVKVKELADSKMAGVSIPGRTY